MTWSPKSNWMRGVYAVALAKRPKDRLTGPIRLDLTFYMPKPKKKVCHKWHTKRPDLDNLEKAVMDALTYAKWWGDYSQVCVKLSSKEYADSLERVGVDIRATDLK